MRKIILAVLICLIAPTAVYLYVSFDVQTRSEPDPNYTFNFNGLNTEESWVKVSGDWTLKDGKLVVRAKPNSIALIRTNVEKVKPSDHYIFGVDFQSPETISPRVGLAFGIVSAENYCKMVLRHDVLALVEVKEGKERLIHSFLLNDPSEKKCAMAVDVFGNVQSISVNKKLIYNSTGFRSKDETEVEKMIREWKISKGDLGLVCESGSCAFSMVTAGGFGKF